MMDDFGLYPREEPFDPLGVMLFKALQVIAFLFFLALLAPVGRIRLFLRVGGVVTQPAARLRRHVSLQKQLQEELYYLSIIALAVFVRQQLPRDFPGWPPAAIVRAGIPISARSTNCSKCPFAIF